MTHALRASSLTVLAVAVFACGGSTSSDSGSSPDASTGDASTAIDAGTADTSAPDAQPCAAPRVTCAGACVDTTTDVTNCGLCGHACAHGATCTAGACAYDTGSSLVLAINKIYLGDTDRNGVTSQTAWKDYGANLDGKTTDKTSTDVCTLTAGAPKSSQTDGTGGIDNGFGLNILPILLTTIGAGLGQKVNDGISTGSAPTIVLRVDGITAQPDAALAPGAGFTGLPFGSSPKWDGTDVWRIDSSSVTNGDITMPVMAFASGAMTSRVWTGAPPALSANLPLLFLSDDLVLVSDVKITMTIAADGRSAVQGTLAGVMPTNAYIAAFQKAAGRISTSLCQGSAFDSIAQQIRQASDILRDGSNTAGAACDAISIGIGFDATIVKLGEVVTPPTLPSPCP